VRQLNTQAGGASEWASGRVCVQLEESGERRGAEKGICLRCLTSQLGDTRESRELEEGEKKNEQ
jgi:hypothetical protein